MKRLIAVVSLTALLSSAALSAELHDLQLHLGDLFITNNYHSDSSGSTVQGSDQHPLNFSIGAAGRLDFDSFWRFRPEARFFWQEYLLTDSGKAVPTQIETGSQVGDVAGSLGVLLRFPWVYEGQLSEKWLLGGGISPTFVLRFPMIPIEGSELGGLYRYFYSSFRFISPELHGYATYRLSEKMAVGLSLSALWPWHNLWDRYDAGALDESMINLSATIHFALGE